MFGFKSCQNGFLFPAGNYIWQQPGVVKIKVFAP